MKKTKSKLKIKERETGEKELRKISLKRHMTVRIPRSMAMEVERFLKTEQAAKMGFDSKADVVTAAIRKLLMDYGYYRPIQRKV